MERGLFASCAEAQGTLVRQVLKRYEEEVFPTKPWQMQDRSRIKLLIEEFGDYRMASLTSTQIAKYRDER